MTPSHLTLVELLDEESSNAHCYHDDVWRAEFKRRAQRIREAIATANGEFLYALRAVNAPDSEPAYGPCDDFCPGYKYGHGCSIHPPRPTRPPSPAHPVSPGDWYTTDFGSRPAPTPPPCATWCGRPLRFMPEGHTPYWLAFNEVTRVSDAYCTPTCRDAGRALNPPKPAK